MVLIDASGINFIDSTAIAMLTKLHAELSERGIILSYARVLGPVRDMMRRAGLLDAVEVEHFHGSILHGVEVFIEKFRHRE